VREWKLEGDVGGVSERADTKEQLEESAKEEKIGAFD